jgi:hypothetical protein
MTIDELFGRLDKLKGKAHEIHKAGLPQDAYNTIVEICELFERSIPAEILASMPDDEATEHLRGKSIADLISKRDVVEAGASPHSNFRGYVQWQ